MAIEGYFEADYIVPAPYVEGSVRITRWRVEAAVRFLVDTGADTTTLNAEATRSLGIAPAQLAQGQQVAVSGVGGVTAYVREPAVVRLYDDAAAEWRSFSTMLDIHAGEEEDETASLPSLLGLDVLNRCRCVIDASEGSVLLNPLIVDRGSGSVYYPPNLRRRGG